MSKPMGEVVRGTFRVCIEINEVETEVISVSSVAELSAKLAHFFSYYNLSDQFLQAKIKRRVLASYNRMIRETHMGPVHKDSRELKDFQEKKTSTPPPAKPKQMATEQKKPMASMCLKPKSGFPGSGFKVGFSSAAFLKNLSALKRNESEAPGEIGKVPKSAKVQNGQPQKAFAVERTMPLPSTNSDAVVYHPSNRYKARRTVADAGIYNFPHNGHQNPAFASRPDASLANGHQFEDVYSAHARRKQSEGVPETSYGREARREPNNHWIEAQFTPSPLSLDRKATSMKECGPQRSFKDDGGSTFDKTNKKPSLEHNLERNRSSWTHTDLHGAGDFYQGNPVYGRHVSIQDPPLASHVRDVYRMQPVPEPIPVTPKDVFNQLDGMKIGLISQKNLNISSLSVTTLKRLQPIISGIYSGDESTCYDLRDFERLLGHLHIDLSDLTG